MFEKRLIQKSRTHLGSTLLLMGVVSMANASVIIGTQTTNGPVSDADIEVGDGTTTTQYTINDPIAGFATFNINANAIADVNSTITVGDNATFTIQPSGSANIQSGAILQSSGLNAGIGGTINVMGFLTLESNGTISTSGLNGNPLSLAPGGTLFLSPNSQFLNQIDTSNLNNGTAVANLNLDSVSPPANLIGNGNLVVNAQGPITLDNVTTGLGALNLIDENSSTVFDSNMPLSLDSSAPNQGQLTVNPNTTFVLSSTTQLSTPEPFQFIGSIINNGTLTINGAQAISGGDLPVLTQGPGAITQMSITSTNTYDSIDLGGFETPHTPLALDPAAILQITLPQGTSGVQDGDVYTLITGAPSEPQFVLEYPAITGFSLTPTTSSQFYPGGRQPSFTLWNYLLTAQVTAQPPTPPQTLPPATPVETLVATLQTGTPLMQSLSNLLSDPQLQNTVIANYLVQVQSNPEALTAALTQLAPQAPTATQSVSHLVNNEFHDAITNTNDFSRIASLTHFELPRGYVAGDEFTPYRVFNPILLNNRTRLPSLDNQPGFKSRTQGIVLVGDRKINDCYHLGLGLGFARSKVITLGGPASQTTIKSPLINGFLTFNYNQAFVEAGVNLSTSRQKMMRSVPFVNLVAESRHHSRQMGFRVKTGYDHTCSKSIVTPYLLLQSSQNIEEDYVETGLGGAGLSLPKVKTRRTQVGLGFQMALVASQTQPGLLTVKGQFLRDTSAKTLNQNAGFISSSVSFPNPTATYNRNTFSLSGDLKCWAVDRQALHISYEVQKNGNIISKTALLNYKFSY